MHDVKILLLLFTSLAGAIFYMAVAHDTSQKAWLLTGLLAVVVLVVSLVELKTSPDLLLRVATFASLSLSMFAGITWYYTRDQATGMLTALSAPAAVGLALGSLLFTRRMKR